MQREHIVLPGSLDKGHKRGECSRCGQEKTEADGIYMGSKFVCGYCWRRQAVYRKKAKK